MKRIAVLYSEYKPVIDALKYTLSDCEVECLTEIGGGKDYDLVVNLCPEKFDASGIVCHHSLLPAFNSAEPEKEAILAGVKVSGITIYNIENGNIITQYPVFIKNDTHYDELKKEMDYLEQVILPVTARKIIDNEQFDIQSFMHGGCSGNCGGCSSCRS